MSKIVPSEVAGIRRDNTDVLVEYEGLDCVLHKVNTLQRDKLGDGKTFTWQDPIETQVHIIWSPEIRMLKALGMYTEEKAPLPIIAYFKFEDDPNVEDYFELEYEYTVGRVKTNKFEVVDRKILGHGEETITVWQIAPLRKEREIPT